MPGRQHFLFIDPGKGRLFSLVPLNAESDFLVPMRLWYRVVSATSMSVKLHGTDSWRPFQFTTDGERLTIHHPNGKSDWEYTTVAPENCPSWLEEKLAEAYQKMDAEEAQS